MEKCKLIFLIVWINLSVSAQDVITSFLDKHEKDDNLEVISIGKKMMEMMDSLTLDNLDLKEALKGLETIRIISSKDKDLNKEYYDSARGLLYKNKGLEEFFSMKGEDKELTVMIRKTKGSVKELILLSEQAEGFNLISLSGTINLDVLRKYSEKLKTKELNHLHSVKHHQ